ncbi:hypothetical protein SKAU_G00212030 [Synaphobranchus kaupii]|uniref:Uncharacterized protein n=1 Tax=Synaphobranchus kaupii TaxID=118154 RepID=A0A9Q1F923_SYNKA|nr:hypothetical protein SKAU_G00212030 [Synaphobranchus kaupii]
MIIVSESVKCPRVAKTQGGQQIVMPRRGEFDHGARRGGAFATADVISNLHVSALLAKAPWLRPLRHASDAHNEYAVCLCETPSEPLQYGGESGAAVSD